MLASNREVDTLVAWRFDAVSSSSFRQRRREKRGEGGRRRPGTAGTLGNRAKDGIRGVLVEDCKYVHEIAYFPVSIRIADYEARYLEDIKIT